jgi:hypothetical protein
MVPCRVETADGKSVAVPELPIPAGAPAPSFRAQFETSRVPVQDRKVLFVVLSGEPGCWKQDPEQALLSPIFDDGHRMIYEFRRAHILTVTARGRVDTRFVAVDPVRGIIGTRTVFNFDIRLMPLTTRCMDHLAGLIDLFPARERVPFSKHTPIPAGEANLLFGQGRHRPDGSAQ